MDGVALGIDALYDAVVSFLGSHGYIVLVRKDSFWLCKDPRFRSCHGDSFDLSNIPTIINPLLCKEKAVAIHWAEVIMNIMSWQQQARETPMPTSGPWTIDCISCRY